MCSIWLADTIAPSGMLRGCHRERIRMPRGPSLTLAVLAMPAVALTLLIAASAPAQAGCSKRVVLYDASWCPYCRQVRAILARNKIRYAVRDATKPHVQAEMIKRFGSTMVPRTLVGGVLVNGVNEARIRQLCR